MPSRCLPSDFLHPKLRKIDAVLVTRKLITVALRPAVRAPSAPLDSARCTKQTTHLVAKRPARPTAGPRRTSDDLRSAFCVLHPRCSSQSEGEWMRSLLKPRRGVFQCPDVCGVRNVYCVPWSYPPPPPPPRSPFGGDRTDVPARITVCLPRPLQRKSNCLSKHRRPPKCRPLTR